MCFFVLKKRINATPRSDIGSESVESSTEGNLISISSELHEGSGDDPPGILDRSSVKVSEIV